MPPELRDLLAKSICMNIRSFRKDGTPVDTPTWVVPIDGKYACCYTDDRTFKYKRMRNNPNVWIAASDVWGRCSTPFYPAKVRFPQEPERRNAVFDALRVKYGIHWKLSLWGSLLTGRVKHRVVLEFEIAHDAQPL
jgi:PPOX class probable F420-dependent enzyme